MNQKINDYLSQTSSFDYDSVIIRLYNIGYHQINNKID